MLLDDLLPDPDATRIEHRVVAGSPPDAYAAAIQVDFLDVARRHNVVRALFGLRSAAEKAATTIRRSDSSTWEPELEALRLADLPERGDWVRLGAVAGEEIAFGVIGRFWGGETVWEEINAPEFTSFGRPGYAKIGCNLSFRPYGASQTLVSYEARTRATDEGARRAFLRYWRLVSPFVGVVMRSTLALIAEATLEKSRSDV
jgi:hypothetical protein